MATSEVQICNIALSHVGISLFMAALTEDSEEANVCSLHYESCRDEVLQQVDWPFARRMFTLGLVEETPTVDWLYSYRYPSDCLSVRRIVSPVGRTAPAIPYGIGNDTTGLVIYTNETDAVVEYTGKVASTGLFPPLFSDALSYLIASKIAIPLSRTKGTADRAYELFTRHLSIAISSTANEDEPGRMVDAEVISTRDSG